MISSFSPAQIAEARAVPFRAVLQYLGVHIKPDNDYAPLDPTSRGMRLQVSYRGRDFRLVVTGEKFVNELLPLDTPNRGGGGAIDLVKHITGLGFVHVVKVCLDAIEASQGGGQ